MPRRIENFDALATSALRRDALAVAEAGYAAVDVGNALRRTLRIEEGQLRVGGKVFPLPKTGAYFVGVGKCAFAAAPAIESIFGEHLRSGVAIDVAEAPKGLAKIEALVGTHPLPSETNEAATKRLMEFLRGKTENDLVIMLISGGGSTLLCQPDAPMTCADESALWTGLTAKAATIQEINTVRKHTSRARGGWLAALAFPSTVVALVASDVPGNDVESISSGPTTLDSSTIADAQAVLERYGMSEDRITLIETPKENKYFDHTSNIVFLSNADALTAMKQKAMEIGYAAEIISNHFSGESRDVGRSVVERLRDTPAKTALLYAGESTVTLGAHNGAGGRSQELALSVLDSVGDDELILPFTSDGRDNTDHAGALSDGVTRAHANSLGLSASEYLETHRTYDFFKSTGDALITGYTGTNVSDLIIAMKQ
jgi:glycerate 2-kinase